MSITARPQGQAIVGLEGWRAGLLLGGILLHGSIGLPQIALFWWIDLLSQAFRMGAFYAIAGILSATALTRQSPGRWMRRRLTRLGLPLAVGLLVIPPFIWALAVGFSWPGRGRPLPFEWYHLWFLAGLIVYSGVVYAMARTSMDTRIVARIERWLEIGRLRTVTVILGTACAMALLFGAAPVVMKAVLSPALLEGFRTLQLIAGYLPMFLLGYFVGMSPTLGAVLLRQWRVAGLIVAIVAATYLLWFGVAAPTLDAAAAAAGAERIRFLGAALCPPAAFVLILRSAIGMAAIPPLVRRLSQASYTMYLLHLPIAAAINLPLGAAIGDPRLSFALAIVGSTAASFAFHEHVVRRSAIATLLLNGRTGARRPIAGDRWPPTSRDDPPSPRYSAYLTEQP